MITVMEIQHSQAVTILLRISIASVFLYAAVGATLQPDNWIGYIPLAVNALIPAKQALLGFSLFQVVLCLWILSGWKAVYAGAVASLTLIAIIVANLSGLDVVFRDIAIFFAALALTVANYKTDTKTRKLS